MSLLNWGFLEFFCVCHASLSLKASMEGKRKCNDFNMMRATYIREHLFCCFFFIDSFSLSFKLEFYPLFPHFTKRWSTLLETQKHEDYSLESNKISQFPLNLWTKILSRFDCNKLLFLCTVKLYNLTSIHFHCRKWVPILVAISKLVERNLKTVYHFMAFTNQIQNGKSGWITNRCQFAHEINLNGLSSHSIVRHLSLYTKHKTILS